MEKEAFCIEEELSPIFSIFLVAAFLYLGAPRYAVLSIIGNNSDYRIVSSATCTLFILNTLHWCTSITEFCLLFIVLFFVSIPTRSCRFLNEFLESFLLNIVPRYPLFWFLGKLWNCALKKPCSRTNPHILTSWSRRTIIKFSKYSILSRGNFRLHWTCDKTLLILIFCN